MPSWSVLTWSQGFWMKGICSFIWQRSWSSTWYWRICIVVEYHHDSGNRREVGQGCGPVVKIVYRQLYQKPRSGGWYKISNSEFLLRILNIHPNWFLVLIYSEKIGRNTYNLAEIVHWRRKFCVCNAHRLFIAIFTIV